MKKLLTKTVVFFAILFGFLIILFLLPATPKSKSYLLFADIDKRELLSKEQANRIIFIGGSNLSFGLNCQFIKDSLALNPINTSIHAGLGLYYMLDSYKQFLHKGDIVIISPEYEQFYEDYAYGEDVLIQTIIDVNPGDFTLLKPKHYYIHLESLPRILLSRVSISDYLYEDSGGIYERSSFNQYGDAVAHWSSDSFEFPANILKGHYNYKLVEYLKDFDKEMIEIGVKVFITYPCFDAISFDANVDKIHLHEKIIKESGVKILGTPGRYRFEKEYCFNSPYHLTKKGAEVRTLLLIEDLKHK